MGDRPMLWKELHVERLAPFSRFVRWMLLVVVVVVLGSSLALGAMIVWSQLISPDSNRAMWATMQLATLASFTSTPVSWLIQWAIGLRAAVAIATERERATWDALLTSPLEGPEIAGAKIMGSLYALRGLIAAAAIAWTVQLMCGATETSDSWTLLGNTLAVATFMAAVGVACSLAIGSATRAIASALGVWLAAAAASTLVAGLIVMVLVLVIFWLSATYAVLFGTGVELLISVASLIQASFETAWVVVRLSLYLLSVLLIWLVCRRRFDVLAGRLPVAPVDRSRPPQA